jgi:hypothetical protein
LGRSPANDTTCGEATGRAPVAACARGWCTGAPCSPCRPRRESRCCPPRRTPARSRWTAPARAAVRSAAHVHCASYSRDNLAPVGATYPRCCARYGVGRAGVTLSSRCCSIKCCNTCPQQPSPDEVNCTSEGHLGEGCAPVAGRPPPRRTEGRRRVSLHRPLPAPRETCRPCRARGQGYMGGKNHQRRASISPVPGAPPPSRKTCSAPR